MLFAQPLLANYPDTVRCCASSLSPKIFAYLVTATIPDNNKVSEAPDSVLFLKYLHIDLRWKTPTRRRARPSPTAFVGHEQWVSKHPRTHQRLFDHILVSSEAVLGFLGSRTTHIRWAHSSCPPCPPPASPAATPRPPPGPPLASTNGSTHHLYISFSTFTTQHVQRQAARFPI